MSTTSDEHLTSAPSVPLVSVLVTCYNQASYVEQALDSLRRQTFRNFEVIITDDASTDGSADVIEAWLARTGYPAQFIRNPTNRGICANRNAALARTSAPFICSLSGDDCHEPDRVERQLQYFLAQPEHVAAVYSDMLVVDAAGSPRVPSFLDAALGGATPPHGSLFNRIVVNNFLPAPAVMLRRSAIAAVGGYDESLFYEDFDMWLRLSARFDFAYLPGLLVRYRTHENSMSHRNRAQMHQCRSQILLKWLDRGLDEEAYRLVLDRLLHNGIMQLLADDDVGARETFDVVVTADYRLVRRVLARSARLPGTGASARIMLAAYRCCRRLQARAFRTARAQTG